MKKATPNSTFSNFTGLRQICNLIPPHLVSKLARQEASEPDARTFSHWSHVVALIFSKLTHSFGLNDTCDALKLNSGPLSAVRGATAPSRNALSHANQIRPSSIAEKLFWAMLEMLGQASPGFGRRKFPGKLRHLKRTIHLLDSTVIELVANCMDWASHRRRKAAAKCHVRLNFETLMPGFVIVDVARQHDNVRAREAAASLKRGEILVFDRAYTDLDHFEDLTRRGVIWVTRMKESLVYDLLDRREVPDSGKVLEDHLIALKNGAIARRIIARVEVDGEEREMTFLTNQLQWAAGTVVELYRCRWEVEVFFKQMKQTLKLCDLTSYCANGIRWQVWIALLVQLLMRYLAWASRWGHSFARLYSLVRTMTWLKRDLLATLRRYGTAQGSYRNLARPEQAYFPALL